ncbi:hypothetical protein DL93DRAFT_2093445 [Clavulina sp. PMI_390]|nr:hypothetical protein DL93DRAFT_2093445 [Clavulina sp. PMI_390]
MPPHRINRRAPAGRHSWFLHDAAQVRELEHGLRRGAVTYPTRDSEHLYDVLTPRVCALAYKVKAPFPPLNLLADMGFTRSVLYYATASSRDSSFVSHTHDERWMTLEKLYKGLQELEPNGNNLEFVIPGLGEFHHNPRNTLEHLFDTCRDVTFFNECNGDQAKLLGLFYRVDEEPVVDSEVERLASSRTATTNYSTAQTSSQTRVPGNHKQAQLASPVMSGEIGATPQFTTTTHISNLGSIHAGSSLDSIPENAASPSHSPRKRKREDAEESGACDADVSSLSQDEQAASKAVANAELKPPAKRVKRRVVAFTPYSKLASAGSLSSPNTASTAVASTSDSPLSSSGSSSPSTSHTPIDDSPQQTFNPSGRPKRVKPSPKAILSSTPARPASQRKAPTGKRKVSKAEKERQAQEAKEKRKRKNAADSRVSSPDILHVANQAAEMAAMDDKQEATGGKRASRSKKGHAVVGSAPATGDSAASTKGGATLWKREVDDTLPSAELEMIRHRDSGPQCLIAGGSRYADSIGSEAILRGSFGESSSVYEIAGAQGLILKC